MEEIRPKIKFEQQLKRDFSYKVAETLWGKNVFTCIQCGNCSGVCPTSIYMDYTPRRIVAMVREGLKEDVLKSTTIWLCSSCYSCTAHCPQGIKITDVMYGLKRMAIEEGYYPKNFPIPILAKDFYDMVRENGRITEFVLATKLLIKTGMRRVMAYMPVGMNLWRTGRTSLKKEQISNKGRKELKKLMAFQGGVGR
ncbi:MAG: 4Fe-4S dicluster domain-containing protein [Syntrophorhabdaceae bacterium]|nr:4Fe-4S dicluster domain-containing protein [Syntrophorhabdaceae bacterium]